MSRRGGEKQFRCAAEKCSQRHKRDFADGDADSRFNNSERILKMAVQGAGDSLNAASISVGSSRRDAGPKEGIPAGRLERRFSRPSGTVMSR
jgi:hypothetical protein